MRITSRNVWSANCMQFSQFNTQSRDFENVLPSVYFLYANPCQNRLSPRKSTSVSLLNANSCQHSSYNTFIFNLVQSCHLARASNFTTKIVSAITWISLSIKSTYRGLPQASHGINTQLKSLSLQRCLTSMLHCVATNAVLTTDIYYVKPVLD